VFKWSFGAVLLLFATPVICVAADFYLYFERCKIVECDMSSLEDPKRRFLRLIPKSNDLTLVVLKGHLLIEEQLDFFIERITREPKALNGARLIFFSTPTPSTSIQWL
jgi:hypothetical protein